jgi:glutamate--cysteine ligase
MNKLLSEKDLIDYFIAGSKGRKNWTIGTENEKFLFGKDNLLPVPYDGNKSIVEIFKILISEFSWKPILEEEKIIGLTDIVNDKNITLEPGGQIELSGAKCSNLHQTFDEIKSYNMQLEFVCKKLDIGVLEIGFCPNWQLSDMPRVPKERYTIMRKYMPSVGKDGLDMMHRTATTQVNLDYSSEIDMKKKFRVSMALQPLISMMFYNSPFNEGNLSGVFSYRSKVWRDTDPARAGYLSFVFDKSFNFDTYTQYALDIPMYFILREGKYIQTNNLTFRNFLLKGYQSENEKRYIADIQDWELHLSTLFPQVRLKKFIEMRGADSGNQNSIMSLAAIWTGLLYSQVSLDASHDIISKWTFEDIIQLDIALNSEGFDAKFRNYKVSELLSELLDLSKDGLKDRSVINSKNQLEDIYLEELFEIIKNKKTPAHYLIDQYSKLWSRDILNIYRNFNS